MSWGFKAWRRQRILRRADLPEDVWRKTLRRLPALCRLSEGEAQRLRRLAILFLHEKDISAAAGLALTDDIRLAIAAQACLLILNLDLDYYAGWRSVVVYPDQFLPQHESMDDAGVVHVTRHPTMGEAWLQGPIVLSAADVLAGGDGVNVVMHECAHKLDMLNGAADGFPPLHRDMDVQRWSRTFTHAYTAFCAEVESGAETALDPYGAEDPGEFFAVLTEAFFEIPGALSRTFGEIYPQLAAFYRQDPLTSWPS